MKTIKGLRKDCLTRQEVLRFESNLTVVKTNVEKLVHLYRRNVTRYDLTYNSINDENLVIKALRFKGVPFGVEFQDNTTIIFK